MAWFLLQIWVHPLFFNQHFTHICKQQHKPIFGLHKRKLQEPQVQLTNEFTKPKPTQSNEIRNPPTYEFEGNHSIFNRNNIHISSIRDEIRPHVLKNQVHVSNGEFKFLGRVEPWRGARGWTRIRSWSFNASSGQNPFQGIGSLVLPMGRRWVLAIICKNLGITRWGFEQAGGG